MDSDIIVMDDPYKYFKHPPFKHITVLDQAESPTSPNSGLLYVQNAAPDGPAAFMFAGITSAVPDALCKLLYVSIPFLPPLLLGLETGAFMTLSISSTLNSILLAFLHEYKQQNQVISHMCSHPA